MSTEPLNVASYVTVRDKWKSSEEGENAQPYSKPKPSTMAGGFNASASEGFKDKPKPVPNASSQRDMNDKPSAQDRKPRNE